MSLPDLAIAERAMPLSLAGRAGLKAAEAAAWCVHVWLLSQLLPNAELGCVLFVLVFAGCAARLLTVGWARWLRSAADESCDASPAWSAAVAGLAARSLIALPVIAVVSAQVGGKLLLPGPELGVMLAAIAGLSGVLRLCGHALEAGSEPARAAVLTGVLPHVLAVAALLLVSETRTLNLGLELVLGLQALSLLVPLVLAARRLPALRWTGDLPKARIFGDSVAQCGTILFRNVDIMVIGLVLSPVEAAIYLIVRGAALLLDMLFGVLGGALHGPISLSHRTGEKMRFVAQAARANLGFLLIGGAGALLLFMAMDPVLQVFGMPAADARQPFIYLIVAQSAPAIFGATHLIMGVTRLDGLRAWLVWAAMPVALLLTFGAAREGLASLAATYAALQIAMAAVCAAIVALRCGVWPGLTAMFHSRIRLR